MAVIITTSADTSGAERDLAAFEQKWVASLKAAGEKGGEGLAEGVEDGLDEIDDAAEKTGKNVEGSLTKAVRGMMTFKRAVGFGKEALGALAEHSASLSDALDRVDKAWGHLLDAIANSAVGEILGVAADALGTVADKAADIIDLLPDFGGGLRDVGAYFGIVSSSADVFNAKQAELLVAMEANKDKIQEVMKGAEVALANFLASPAVESYLDFLDMLSPGSKEAALAATTPKITLDVPAPDFGDNQPKGGKGKTKADRINEETAAIEEAIQLRKEAADLWRSEQKEEGGLLDVDDAPQGPSADMASKLGVGEINVEAYKGAQDYLTQIAQDAAAQRRQIEQEHSAAVAKMWQDSIGALGNTLATGFGGAVGDAFGTLFDNISEGQRLFANVGAGLQKATAAFLKSTGKQMIASGVADELKGTAMTILADPMGPPLVSLGLAEIGTGLAMGGVGGFLGRGKGGGGASHGGGGGGSSGGGGEGNSLGRGSQGTVTLPTVNINVYSGGAPGSTTLNLGDAKGIPEHTQIQIAKELERMLIRGRVYHRGTQYPF